MDEKRLSSDLKEKIKELEFTSHVLHVQQELSLDGILVIDSDWNIVSFNQCFVDMWGNPLHTLNTKDDRACIQSVLGKLKNPKQFLSKMEYLTAHPTEKSKDELELNDGKFFEHYSAPIIDNEDVLVGQVWFFRDITKIKEGQEGLQQRTSQLKAVSEELLDSKQECIAHQEELTHKNIVLRSLLHTLEEEKELLEKKTASTFREAFMPLLELLKESLLAEPQQHLVDTIEHILSNMSSSLTHSMQNNTYFFTPTEMKVANFIKAGKTTKEISTILNSSNRTVEGHRLSIRKKFELKSGQNLSVFLLSLK